MPNKMLIDATHPEETRVVVVRGNRVEEFDFESAQRKQLRGNIYLAKVTRVEPSLQAAFIEYGGNRHGFLAFSEIHPDYYQIPVADRQALIEAEEQAHREAEEEAEHKDRRRRSRHRSSRRRGHGERVRSEIVGEAADTETLAAETTPSDTADTGDAALIAAPATQEQPEAAPGHETPPVLLDTPAEPAGSAPPTEVSPIESATPVDADAPDAVAAAPVVEAEAAIVAAEPAESEASVATSEARATEVGSEPEAAIETRDHVAHDDHASSDEIEHDEHGDEAHPDDAHADEVHADEDDDDAEDDEDEDDAEEQVELVGGDDIMEEVPERAYRPRKQYKIQEVIKRRQVMLVQVVKEERGNKGAALTTYLSLAGRYAVLMPNTARGGGISRKITSSQDRSRLKEVVQDLDVPEGMGVILRTAGASRTKPEIKRDFEYLLRLWETVRDTTLKSQAPTLVYEEGSLIKRSLRDLYNKEIDDIMVAGDAGYHEARDFMKMLMPSNVKAVKSYHDAQPLFSKMGVESQLDAMFSPTVQLRSGGYIVINQTEALVSIDVNSGRSTREHHIEDTALKTNLEAAEEVARQLRLRDLAGLIVIDFIDMDEKRNNRAVERKLSDCLRQDRARIQVGRISHFGLLEMSRQRIRASVLESSTEICPHCGGTGHVRSVASVALQLLRSLEEVLMKGATHNLVVRTRTDVALYVLNHKRAHLRNLEDSFEVTLSIIADATANGHHPYTIDRGEQVHTLEAAKALLTKQSAAAAAFSAEEAEDEDFEAEAEIETDETEGLVEDASGETDADSDGEGRRRRRRRRRRGGRDRTEGRDDSVLIPEAQAAGDEPTQISDDDDAGEDSDTETEGDAVTAETSGSGAPDDGDRPRRRRGRRGGRRRRNGQDPSFEDASDEGMVGSIVDDLEAPAAASEAMDAVADLETSATDETPPADTAEAVAAPQPEPTPFASEPLPAPAPVEDRPARRGSTVREKVSFSAFLSPSESVSAPSPADEMPASTAPSVESGPAPETTTSAETSVRDAVEEATPGAEAAPRRVGWWAKRFGGG